MSEIKVSVLVMTYNHEKFIARTLESALIQKTDFDFEIVIGEDCSKDNTRIICEQYQNNYPKIIRLLPAEKNIGMVPNFLKTIKNCNGDFIALLEGDDLWIDPKKLQKQKEIFDSDNAVSICFHDAFVVNKIKKKRVVSFFTKYSKNQYIDFNECVMSWQMPTASIFFRKYQLEIPSWFRDIKNWDWAIQILLASKGKVYYLDDFMSVYRKHVGGNSFNPEYSAIRTCERLVKLLEHLKNEIPNRDTIFNKSINRQLFLLSQYRRKKAFPILFNLMHPLLSAGKLFMVLGKYIIKKRKIEKTN